MSEHFFPVKANLDLRAIYVDVKQQTIMDIPVVAMRVVPPDFKREAFLVAVVLDSNGRSVDVDEYAETCAQGRLILAGIGQFLGSGYYVLNGALVYKEQIIGQHATKPVAETESAPDTNPHCNGEGGKLP